MAANVDGLITQLDRYVQQTQAQLHASPDQSPYWRGVLFGLELALLEARKQPAPLEPPPAPSDAFYESVNRLVFQHLENLIALCQAPIKRDLLVYNAKVARYDLLKAIRQQTDHRAPSDYELQAIPDSG
jgi:hypothetical protein